MIVSGLALITGALQDLSILSLGQVPGGAEADDALVVLNQLGDALGLDRVLLYALVRTLKTLASGTASYTVGTGGSIDIPRPDFIAAAKLIQDTGATTPTEIPISVLDEQQYAAWSQKTLQSSQPRAIFYDKSFDANQRGLIYPLPIPNVATTQLALYTPGGQLAAFELATDVVVPRGWSRMLRKNLALELAPSYPMVSPSRMLIHHAATSLRSVKRASVRIPSQRNDPSLVRGGGYFDIDAGTFR